MSDPSNPNDWQQDFLAPLPMRRLRVIRRLLPELSSTARPPILRPTPATHRTANRIPSVQQPPPGSAAAPQGASRPHRRAHRRRQRPSQSTIITIIPAIIFLVMEPV